MSSLQTKVDQYNTILANTENYRKAWNKKLKPMIKKALESQIKETGLNAKVDVKDNIQNLEVIACSLGHGNSGIAEKIPDSESTRPFLKSNGALIYQQLFNGKVMIMIMYPYIENYGDPKPPKTIEILRPEEFKEPYITRHLEEFIREMIDWEDYDDDVPDNISMAPIGFNQLPDDIEEKV